jgi:hypothetical protein
LPPRKNHSLDPYSQTNQSHEILEETSRPYRAAPDQLGNCAAVVAARGLHISSQHRTARHGARAAWPHRPGRGGSLLFAAVLATNAVDHE